MDLRRIHRIGGAHGNVRFHGPPAIGAGVDSPASERDALVDPYRHLKPLSMALSVGIHGAVLSCFLQTAALHSVADQSTGPITVDVINAATPQLALEEAPPQAQQVRPQPEPVSPKMAVPERSSADLASRPSVKAHPLLKAQPQQTPSAPTNTASVTFGPSDTPSSSTSISPSTESADSTTTRAGDPSSTANDRLRAYGEMVWARIMTHKPAGIRLRGAVTLTFSLSRDGRLDAAAVSTSSGADSLDQIALAALHDAAPFPPPPAELSAQSLTFSIPFYFR